MLFNIISLSVESASVLYPLSDAVLITITKQQKSGRRRIRRREEEKKEERDVWNRGGRLRSKLSNSVALIRPALEENRGAADRLTGGGGGGAGERRRRGETAKGWVAGAKLDEHSD